MAPKRKHSSAVLEEERLYKRQLRSGGTVQTSPQTTIITKQVATKPSKRPKTSPNKLGEPSKALDLVADHNIDTKDEVPRSSICQTPTLSRKTQSPSLACALSDETNIVRMAGNEGPRKKTIHFGRPPKPNSAQKTILRAM